MAALTNDALENCQMLPLPYQEICRTLEKAYSHAQAEALARAMCEIDMGAGELSVRELLERHFPEEQAAKLARLLFVIGRGLLENGEGTT